MKHLSDEQLMKDAKHQFVVEDFLADFLHPKFPIASPDTFVQLSPKLQSIDYNLLQILIYLLI